MTGRRAWRLQPSWEHAATTHAGRVHPAMISGGASIIEGTEAMARDAARRIIDRTLAEQGDVFNVEVVASSGWATLTVPFTPDGAHVRFTGGERVEGPLVERPVDAAGLRRCWGRATVGQPS